MGEQPMDWPGYIRLMEQLLAVPLDDPRREALALQLARIADIAGTLWSIAVRLRPESAGVYRL